MAKMEAYQEATMPAEFFTTTILALNIHCSSCILHIRSIFEALGDQILQVEVSIVSHEVQIQHSSLISPDDLCRMLSEEAFEVHYSRTTDAHGVEVSTKDFDAIKSPRGSRFRSSKASLTSASGHLLSSQEEWKQKQHLINCAACRDSELNRTADAGHKQDDAISETRVEPASISKSLQDLTEQYRATLSIGGMTCASCVTNISSGLKDLPFVQSANITLMTNSGEVEFTSRDKLDKIIEVIEDSGYECALNQLEPIQRAIRIPIDVRAQTQRTLKLKIDGMFCNHCPGKAMDALQNFGDAIIVEQVPTMKEPILGIAYTPSAPDLTIRKIVSAIDASNDAFRTRSFHPPSLEDQSKRMQLRERRSILARLAVSSVMAVPTFIIGIVLTTLLPESTSTRQLLERPLWSGTATATDWALFILATVVMLFATDIFHRRAFKEISSMWRRGSKVPILRRFYRFGSMNLLISAGTGVAYLSSLALLILDATSTRMQGSNTYFDSVVFLTFFILIGRFLESYSKSKSGDAVALLGKLRPEFATLVVSDDETPNATQYTQPTRTLTIDTDLLELGDHVIVPHGSSPPADGTVDSASGSFNESALTGESRAVIKAAGDKVFVGTINSGNPITMTITELGGTSMLDQIVAVVQHGQTKRAPVERLADVLTAYFVPVITALAIMTYVIWLALGFSGALNPRYLNGQAGGWAYWSLEFAIAVFVVACPCGIGLAAPTALFVGVGLAAKHGILVRGGGEAFQEASEIDIVVFDKTGTLTEGRNLQVTDHEVFDGPPANDIWAITKALEEQSSHPIARAILTLASQQKSASLEILNVIEVPGLGIRGSLTIDSIRTYEAALGSEDFISKLDTNQVIPTEALQQISRWQNQQKSTAILAVHRIGADSPGWITSAIFATADPIRPSALPTIQALQARGLAVYLLSGDNPTTARAVGTSLGIPTTNIFAGVLPTQKAEKIAHLQAHGPCRGKRSAQRPRKVAFVGDGINDAPALLAASVGISPSTGSPIALTSSSFVLLSSSLMAIPDLLDLSVRVFRRIKFNFFWALVYNVLLIPVAAGTLFKVRDDGWRFSPVWASVAMAGSSVSVVVSSLLLRWEWRR